MSDIADRARKPLVDRAKDWAADAQVAHTYGVGIRADLSTIAMVRELVAEVERLRATVTRVDALARRWVSAREMTSGNSSIVARAFAAEVHAALEVPDDRP